MAGPLNKLPAAPRNAQLAPSGDKAVVTADARAGLEVTDKALGKAVLPLLTRSGTDRAGEVDTRRIQPEVTRENAARLGLTEKLSSFTVNFEPAAYRTTNVGRAVDLINGSVVMPGETWSFNRTVGARTEANGFVDGIMIYDDQYAKAPGGGVSAVATTVFNAMFFAGLEDIYHKPHSLYFSRYPMGREATLDYNSVDMKFRNDTEYGVLMQAFFLVFFLFRLGMITGKGKSWLFPTPEAEAFKRRRKKMRGH